MDSTLRPSPATSPKQNAFSDSDVDDGDDRISTRSIPLSSPTTSVAPSSSNELQADSPKDFGKIATSETAKTRQLRPLRLKTRIDSSEPANTTATKASTDTETKTNGGSDATSHRNSEAYTTDAFVASPSTDAQSKPRTSTTTTTYPPSLFSVDDTSSMVSFASSSSKKARPESNLLEPPEGPLVPGICLVDFNHLAGPVIEFSDGDIFKDEQLASIMPFLALPDGAHLNAEDYSYFHLVPTSPNPTTVFGISCNRQIKSADLLSRDEDVTRSTVQKAVVVLASKPLFGPIRDRLGVVTRALFEQRDFRDMSILTDFRASLELSLRSQLTESAVYMGTNLRELVHKFRWRTLLLLKTLMLQKRIMFLGHPVERLCTYQYSLVSLIPGLLQTLDDSGSPPLASRAPTLTRATSLRTSDRKSLMAYLGLPLDIFGKDAFFQPYLPLQQVDMIKETRSWLCGCTNSIVTQQKEIDLLVNIESNTFEFRDPNLERLVGLTPADRAWMDEIVRDVNEHFVEGSDTVSRSALQYKGGEDYLRHKFEEYVTGALSSVKYADFLSKGAKQDILITGTEDGGDANAIQDFNPLWIQDFKRTNAFEVWNRITDPMLFDIAEARHPCISKPTVVADISLRLSEGLQELHLDQQLAPAREVVSRTFASGSESFFRAVEGVRGRWAQRSPSSGNLPADAQSMTSSTSTGTTVEVTRSDAEEASKATAGQSQGLKPLSLSVGAGSESAGAVQGQSTQQQAQAPTVADVKATLGSWGSSIGSFISQRTVRLATPATEQTSTPVASSTPTSSSTVFNAPSSTAQSQGNAGGSPTKATPSSRPPSTASTTSSFSLTFGRASLLSSRLSSSLGSVVSKAENTRTQSKTTEVEEEFFKPKDLGEFRGHSWSGSSDAGRGTTSGTGTNQVQAPMRSLSENLVQRVGTPSHATTTTIENAPAAASSTSPKSGEPTTMTFPAGQ